MAIALYWKTGTLSTEFLAIVLTKRYRGCHMAARRYEFRVLKWAKRTSEISFQHSNVIFCLLSHKLNTKLKALHWKAHFYNNVTVATVIFLLVTSRGEVSFLSANLQKLNMHFFSQAIWLWLKWKGNHSPGNYNPKFLEFQAKGPVYQSKESVSVTFLKQVTQVLLI